MVLGPIKIIICPALDDSLPIILNVSGPYLEDLYFSSESNNNLASCSAFPYLPFYGGRAGLNSPYMAVVCRVGTRRYIKESAKQTITQSTKL